MIVYYDPDELSRNILLRRKKTKKADYREKNVAQSSGRNFPVSDTIRETSIKAKVAWQTKLFINVISHETFSVYPSIY